MGDRVKEYEVKEELTASPKTGNTISENECVLTTICKCGNNINSVASSNGVITCSTCGFKYNC